MQKFIYTTNQSTAVTKAILRKPMIPRRFVKNVYTEFHENPANSLVFDINHKKTERQKWLSNENIFCPRP
jgi:hypothetical protein